MTRHVTRTVALLLATLLACALTVPSYAATVAEPAAEPAAAGSSTAPAPLAAASDDTTPGQGKAPQATRGTDGDQAADEGVSEGTPVWIFYVLVVVVAVGGLVFGLLRRRSRRQH